ncbi:UPF0246 protein YaaA [hydrothermal vent metagenome]|uniref:UPF0246 protein YaaA n=1 Tax=hydrothermal vent metagenome TaxID=652676 RepID=A0A1W1B9H9_9ZZZZ
MKILLAPSETKKSGGESPFLLDNLSFSLLNKHRKAILHRYINILQKNDISQLGKMFGLKKESDILYHNRDIVNEPAMKAIERYTGVAFDYLDYDNLPNDSKEYIDSNVIIFSNLFGPIKADDLIPEYRLKQGESIGDIKVDKFYREHSAHIIEEYLQDEEILDLRAIYYNKFYKPTKEYTTLKFIKGGRVVSHWAKAYRGVVLRAIAKSGVESIDDFMKLPIENLSVDEVTQKGTHREIVYSII